MARRAPLLDEMAADPATKGNVHSFPCDVADPKAVQVSVSQIEAQLGAIDVLVLNAAVGHPGVNFWENSIDDIDNVIDINLKGVMWALQSKQQSKQTLS